MIRAIQPDCIMIGKQLIKISQEHVKQQENLISATKYLTY